MTPSVLILLAAVLSVEGDLARIDKGRDDGVRPGDPGRIYYTLRIGPDRAARRIDVGEIEILEVDVASASFRVPGTFRVRPGYSLEIDIPRSRFRPTVVRIPAGSYAIGLDLAEARFYNQHPRFETEVGTFEIDRRPVSGAEFRSVYPEYEAEDFDDAAGAAEHGFAVALTFAAAAEYCRRLDKRLPTELEWEIAARDPQFERRHPIHEWTSSWYLPYPGNGISDEDYGRSHRVLRGGVAPAAPEELDHRLRRFLEPAASHPNVGFRCAWDESPEHGKARRAAGQPGGEP